MCTHKCCVVLCLGARLCLTLCDPMSVAHQAPLSMGLSSQEYWSGLPCPPAGDLPNPEIKPRSLPDCRRTLYRLSYRGSPGPYWLSFKYRSVTCQIMSSDCRTSACISLGSDTGGIWMSVQRNYTGTSLVVQWLRLWASTARDTGSILGQGIKILHVSVVVV